MLKGEKIKLQLTEQSAEDLKKFVEEEGKARLKLQQLYEKKVKEMQEASQYIMEMENKYLAARVETLNILKNLKESEGYSQEVIQIAV